MKNLKYFIPSVNFHLWEPCNMRCGFCFATFQDVKKSILPKGHLPKDEAIQVIRNLAKSGFTKITFAGGEPTLCPWINDLIFEAKTCGLTTMIVTNGTKLTDDFLAQNVHSLDWIALSIDSLEENSNLLSGRAISGKKVLTKNIYYELVDKIKTFGYGLKINTVVSCYNHKEKLIDFIEYAKPSRWKVFQVLPIKGQNDFLIDSFLITDKQFNTFLDLNKLSSHIIKIIPESNDAMTGSYVMVDPAGRFFTNISGTHIYSKPINQIGVTAALEEMNYNNEKFIAREGLYDWENKKNDVT